MASVERFVYLRINHETSQVACSVLGSIYQSHGGILSMATATDNELVAHPLALIFPPLCEDDLAALVDDIRRHGLRDKIVLHEGRILDGRNRFAACEEAGVEPEFVDFDGSCSPLDYVISRNLHRRHLDESQRGMVAARIAELSGTARKEPTRKGEADEETADTSENCDQGSIEPIRQNVLNGDSEPVTTEQAAAMMNVSKATVKRARKVVREGSEKLNEAVQSGQVSVADAAAIVDKPEEVQEAAIESVTQGRSRTAKEAAERISPTPPKPKKGSKGKPDLSKLFKAFDESLGKTIRALDDVANVTGEDKFTKGVREGFSWAKTKMAELKRAHR